MYVGSLISDRFGRRMCIFVMSLYAMVSSAVIVSSNTKAQILTGRTIHCELPPPKRTISMVN